MFFLQEKKVASQEVAIYFVGIRKITELHADPDIAGKKSETRHCGTARPGRKRRTEKAACRGPRQQSQRAVNQAHKRHSEKPARRFY